MQDEQTQSQRISFLATGNEIVQGDVQDSNGARFAKTIHEQGGVPFQRLQVSDHKLDIESALRYLLAGSDAVIITGGLGPTSDDTTRFAVSDVLMQPLQLNEASWLRITQRLNRFNIPVNESNRQQALFPSDAILLHNAHGTAEGAHLRWHDKHLFMLPGPPRECVPMFEQYVLPFLAENGFFTRRQHHRWLTLGLMEGEIGPRIDELARPYPVETGFRWNYPYLEIKISGREGAAIQALLTNIEAELAPNLVSRDARDAFTVLADALQGKSQIVQLIDELSTETRLVDLPHPAIQRIAPGREVPPGLVVKIAASSDLKPQASYSGTLTLTCIAYFNQKQIYEHVLRVPNRGPEVLEFGKVYLAWQISRVVGALNAS